jgi:hypothetical protein
VLQNGPQLADTLLGGHLQMLHLAIIFMQPFAANQQCFVPIIRTNLYLANNIIG